MDPEISSILAIFEDRNEDVFGANAYAVWTLLQQGNPYWNELSGAVFAARLKEYIYKHSGVTFGEHVPFLALKLSKRN